MRLFAAATLAAFALSGCAANPYTYDTSRDPYTYGTANYVAVPATTCPTVVTTTGYMVYRC